MNRRLTRWLLALYPRYWRDRYGPEVADLNEQLISAGETTRLRAGLGMIAGAAIERGRALAGSRQAVLASVLAAIIAVAGLAFGLSNSRPASQAASTVSLACVLKPGPLPVPVYVRGKPGEWAVVPSGLGLSLEPAPTWLKAVARQAAARAKRQAAARAKRQVATVPRQCRVRRVFSFALAPSSRIITVITVPGAVRLALPSKPALRAAQSASRP